MSKCTTKPRKPNVRYSRVPGRLYRKIKKHLPKQRRSGRGRPPADNHAVLNGIWYVLWTGCQWKAVEREWFGVCSSVIHARFQVWRRQGVFETILAAMLRYYGRVCHIRWVWQSVDSRSCPAPLGGRDTGKNPTDRAKLGGRSTSLWTNEVLPCRSRSQAPTKTTSGMSRRWCARSWRGDPRPPSTSVRTRLMTAGMCISSCSNKGTSLTSSIVAWSMSPKTLARSPARHDIRPGDGS